MDSTKRLETNIGLWCGMECVCVCMRERELCECVYVSEWVCACIVHTFIYLGVCKITYNEISYLLCSLT